MVGSNLHRVSLTNTGQWRYQVSVLFKHELLDWLFTCVWSCDHVKLHASLFVQSNFQSLGFRYPIKLIWWAYLSCICSTHAHTSHADRYSHLLSAQCSTHSSIRHYLVVVSWLVLIHIPIGLTLIIAVIGVEWIRHWSLGNVWIWIDWTCIIRLESSSSVVVDCLTLLVYIVRTSCVHCSHFLYTLLFV